ncbi:MAG: 50S ribosomal protein L11 methyltransferase [Bacteroidota bacterium]
MRYYKASFTLPEGNADILIAFLGEAGFEMFEEAGSQVAAYFPAEGTTEAEVASAIRTVPEAFTGNDWMISLTEDRNWNEEWEKSFSPVEIAGKVVIRAPFHAPIVGDEMIELIIEPKMSFGTGHHPTTALMVEAMMGYPFKDLKVLDMGCGSGLLAILAEKLGSSDLSAIDIDDWSVENSLENVARNGCAKITVAKGNASSLSGTDFDIILANINRNILLQDLPRYVQSLRPGGRLFMSGFLQDDRKILVESAGAYGLKEEKSLVNGQWTMLVFLK